MRVLKVWTRETAEFYEYVRRELDPGQRFYGYILVNKGIHCPWRKREPAWIHPREVRIAWLRDFSDDSSQG